MSLAAVRNHWLFNELFREPSRGWLGWGIATAAIVWTAEEALRGNTWMIPLLLIPIAEIYPKGDAITAGYLRLVGLLYMVGFGLYLAVMYFIL